MCQHCVTCREGKRAFSRVFFASVSQPVAAAAGAPAGVVFPGMHRAPSGPSDFPGVSSRDLIVTLPSMSF